MKEKRQPVEKKNDQEAPFLSQESINNSLIQSLSSEELKKLLITVKEENQLLQEQNANLTLRDVRFQLVANNSPDTILFQNKDLVYTWVINSTPLMAMEQIVGKTDFDLLAPNEAKKYYKIKTRLLVNGLSHYEEISTKVNETIHYFSLLFQAWRDNAGNIIGIATYSRDISDKKTAELELKQQMEGEKLVAEITAQFIAAKIAHLEEHIPAALQKMAEYLEADRGFIRFVDPTNDTIQRGFDWKHPHLSGSQIETPGLPFENFGWTKTQLQKNLPVFVQEAIQIPDEARDEREFLIKAGIKSLVLLPLFLFGKFVGYVGFGSKASHPFWSEREKSLLDLFRSTIASVLERQERENALNESQEQYQKLVELNPNITVLIQEKKILYINPAGAQILGFNKPEDVTGKFYEDLIPPAIIMKFKNQNEVLKGKISGHPLEFTFNNRDGESISIEYSTHSFRFRGIDTFLFIGVDITHRKMIEREIEGNRKFLDDILNISPLAIFVFDRKNNHFSYFNNATCEILGFTPDQIWSLDQNQVIQMVHPDDLKNAIEMNEKLKYLPIGNVVEGEYRWVKSNGEISWLHSYQTAISRTENGSTLQSLTIVQNITDIKMAQVELKQSEAKFRGLIENIPGMIYQSMFKESYSTLFVSDYFEKLTSLKKDDALVKGLSSWMELVHPDDLEKLSTDIQDFNDAPKPFETEYRIRNANGEYIWVEDIGRVTFDEDGNPFYVNGLIMDISARKRDYEAMQQLSQDNLRLLAQARRDSETKTLLLNEVNHRVKNNIASIIGLLELESRREIRSTSEFQTTLANIKTRISSLATVHDILSSNQWAPVQLEFFVRKIIENAAASSPIGRKIAINIYAHDRNIWINSRQATALALILNELTTNSIRHAFSIRENGTITITIRKEAKTSNRVRISFADDGPGWPEDILEGKGGNVGMQVIRLSTISPLNGEIKFENHDGAVATISFNLTPQREVIKPSTINAST